MPKYKIPVQWEMYGEMEVEADTLQQAREIVILADDGFPHEKLYVDGSFEINEEFLKSLYPDEV